MVLGRWEGQKWETSGDVHVYLLKSEMHEIHKASEMTEEDIRWMEFHVSHEKVND